MNTDIVEVDQGEIVNALVSDELTNAANAMYRALCNLPCGCGTRWANGDKVLVRQCQRCIAIARWEEAAQLTNLAPLLARQMPVLRLP